MISLRTSLKNRLFTSVAYGLLYTNTFHPFLSSERVFWAALGALQERPHHGCNSKKSFPDQSRNIGFWKIAKIPFRAPFTSTQGSFGRFSGDPCLQKTVISIRTSFKNPALLPAAYTLFFTPSSCPFLVFETPFWASPGAPMERAPQRWDSKKSRSLFSPRVLAIR